MIYVTPKKLHAKKEEKLLKRFRDRPPPPSILTDSRTTDKAALEKFRCLSAGGAKKGICFVSGNMPQKIGRVGRDFILYIFFYSCTSQIYLILILYIHPTFDTLLIACLWPHTRSPSKRGPLKDILIFSNHHTAFPFLSC